MLTRSTILAALLVLPVSAFAKSDDSHKSDSDSHHSDSHHSDESKVSCPCFTKKTLKSEFGKSDLCFDYTATSTHGNGTYLAYYTGQGKEAGVADWYYASVPFCADVNLTTGAGAFVAPVTTDQYDACADIVLDVAEDLGLKCATAP